MGNGHATREFLRDHQTQYRARLEAVLACKARGVSAHRLYIEGVAVLLHGQHYAMHLFRTIDPALTQEFAEGARSATLDALFSRVEERRPPRAASGYPTTYRVTRHSAFLASTKQTAHHVDRLLNVDDPMDLLHGFQPALDELARLAARAGRRRRSRRRTLGLAGFPGGLRRLLRSASSLIRRWPRGKMAERALATEPDPYMQAYTTSCRGPESWVAFDLFTHRQAELMSDQEFRYQLLLRIGYPVFPVFPGHSYAASCAKSRLDRRWSTP